MGMKLDDHNDFNKLIITSLFHDTEGKKGVTFLKQVAKNAHESAQMRIDRVTYAAYAIFRGFDWVNHNQIIIKLDKKLTELHQEITKAKQSEPEVSQSVNFSDIQEKLKIMQETCQLLRTKGGEKGSAFLHLESNINGLLRNINMKEGKAEDKAGRAEAERDLASMTPGVVTARTPESKETLEAKGADNNPTQPVTREMLEQADRARQAAQAMGLAKVVNKLNLDDENNLGEVDQVNFDQFESPENLTPPEVTPEVPEQAEQADVVFLWLASELHSANEQAKATRALADLRDGMTKLVETASLLKKPGVLFGDSKVVNSSHCQTLLTRLKNTTSISQTLEFSQTLMTLIKTSTSEFLNTKTRTEYINDPNLKAFDEANQKVEGAYQALAQLQQRKEDAKAQETLRAKRVEEAADPSAVTLKEAAEAHTQLVEKARTQLNDRMTELVNQAAKLTTPGRVWGTAIQGHSTEKSNRLEALKTQTDINIAWQNSKELIELIIIDLRNNTNLKEHVVTLQILEEVTKAYTSLKILSNPGTNRPGDEVGAEATQSVEQTTEHQTDRTLKALKESMYILMIVAEELSFRHERVPFLSLDKIVRDTKIKQEKDFIPLLNKLSYANTQTEAKQNVNDLLELVIPTLLKSELATKTNNDNTININNKNLRNAYNKVLQNLRK